MLTRRLTLSRETLAELTAGELSAVAGAGAAGTNGCTTILTFLTCDPTCFTEA